MKSPLCRQCKKPLPAHYEHRCLKCGALSWRHKTSASCSEVFDLMTDRDPKRTKKVLTGYGYSDNGFFCTLRCGYEAALRAAKEGK